MEKYGEKTIGELVKIARVGRGFTKEKLSDCCTVRALQNIEKGRSVPSYDTVTKLSRKLNVDLLTYLKETSNPELTITSKDIREMKEMKEKKNFKELLIRSSDILKDDSYNLNINDKQLLVRYKAMSHYLVHNDYEEAINIIHSVTKFNFKTTEINDYLDIYISDIEIKLILLKSFLYLNNEKFDECADYLESYKLFDKDYGEHSITRLSGLVRIEYNRLLSKFYKKDFNDFEDSLNGAIKVCLDSSLYDSLTHFYWLAASYYFDVEDLEACYKYCYKYLNLCTAREIDDMFVLFAKDFKKDFGYNHIEYSTMKIGNYDI